MLPVFHLFSFSDFSLLIFFILYHNGHISLLYRQILTVCHLLDLFYLYGFLFFLSLNRILNLSILFSFLLEYSSLFLSLLLNSILKFWIVSVIHSPYITVFLENTQAFVAMPCMFIELFVSVQFKLFGFFDQVYRNLFIILIFNNFERILQQKNSFSILCAIIHLDDDHSRTFP